MNQINSESEKWIAGSQFPVLFVTSVQKRNENIRSTSVAAKYQSQGRKFSTYVDAKARPTWKYFHWLDTIMNSQTLVSMQNLNTFPNGISCCYFIHQKFLFLVRKVTKSKERSDQKLKNTTTKNATVWFLVETVLLEASCCAGYSTSRLIWKRNTA